MNKIPQNNNHNDDIKQKLFSIEKDFIVGIEKNMDIFFDALKGIQFVFEQNSESDYKQSLNYVALNNVIQNKQKVQKNFITSVKSAFKYFLQSEHNFFINENLHIGNFHKSKSQEKQNEYTIVSNLIAKVEEINTQNLSILNQIFSNYAAGRKLSLNQLPISPYVLMYSLIASIENMDLNAGIRMIMYNSFEINVLLKLNVHYADLVNKYQINEKIETQKPQLIKQSQDTDAKYTIIEKILNRQHLTNQNNADDKPIITHDLMIHTLNILQEKHVRLCDKDPNYYIEPNKLPKLLKAGIKKLDNNSSFMKYDKKDSNSIRLVELLFKYIESDVGIRSLLRVILMKLQISVLKGTLTNGNIFKNSSDPFRLLLNQMSQVPVGFSDELNQNHKYIIKCNEIVNSILKQTAYDHEFFQNKLDELKAFIKKMRKKFNLIQKRIKEKEVGLEKIAQTKLKVKHILEQKMHKKHMPVYIKDLLLGVWKNVLVLEFLRHPEKSRACQSKIEFVEMILTHINKESIDRSIIKEIVNLYGEGLSLVAFNSKEQKSKESELMKFLNKTQQIQSENVAKQSLRTDEYKLILFKKNESNPANQNDEINPKKDYYDDLVLSIKIGTWLEFTEENNKKTRAKVSWISPITHNFLMVNSNGVRLSDKSPADLADAFRNKKCNELQIIPLIDRALLKIAKNLNESS